MYRKEFNVSKISLFFFHSKFLLNSELSPLALMDVVLRDMLGGAGE